MEYDYYGFPCEYLVVPAFLVAINGLLLPLVGRRGWLRLSGALTLARLLGQRLDLRSFSGMSALAVRWRWSVQCQFK